MNHVDIIPLAANKSDESECVASHRAVIANGIRTWRQIEFVYGSEFMIVEPYALGTSQRRIWLLQAWQIYGTRPGWQLFRLDRISNLRETERPFRPLHDFSNVEDPFKTVRVRVCLMDAQSATPEAEVA